MKPVNAQYWSYGFPLVMAVLVHVAAGFVMTVNWKDTTISQPQVRPYYIEASVVGENPYKAKDNQRKSTEKNQRDTKLNQRRRVEAKLDRDKAVWEKERADRPRPEAIEPLVEDVVEKVDPEFESVDDKPDIETVRSAFAEAINEALTREENARKAVTDDEKAMAYVSQIQREIVQKWSRPPSARNGMETLLRVRLIPTGEVIDVKVEDSSGNDAFDRSAIQAVRKAEYFVVPKDALSFERYFRSFTVLFRPEDLRL
ncbi:MAG: colicin import membrane protein [Candidatus Azotimanducaceae bacterium]|jgi:colicin import membrane protein